MTRYVFEEVKRTATKRGECACGVRRTRSKSFVKTINPYNKNDQGIPKTHAEVLIDIYADIDRWRDEPITCRKCEQQP